MVYGKYHQFLKDGGWYVVHFKGNVFPLFKYLLYVF